MNNYKSSLWKFYAASILGGFAYFYNGINTLYYRHFHLSFEQIGFLVSASLIATLIFEIPTGSFADVYGKKRSILIGSFNSLIGIGFLVFGSSLTTFALGFIFLGIGKAFNSGAGNALLYDFLYSVNRQHEYLKHQSRMQSAYVSIDILSGSIGFLLFGLNVRIPYIVSFIAMALVILVQLSMKEVLVKKVYTDNIFFTHFTQIREGLFFTLKSNVILWLVGFSLIYSIMFYFFGDILNLPFFTEVKHFTITQLAIMGFIWNTIQTVSILFVHSIENKLGQYMSLFAIVLLTPLLLFGLILSNSFLLSAFIIGLFWGIGSFRELTVDAYMNKHINSSHRATVLSVNSMILSSITLLILPFLGSFTDKAGLKSGMLLLIIGTLVLGGLMLFLRQKTLQRPAS